MKPPFPLELFRLASVAWNDRAIYDVSMYSSGNVLIAKERSKRKLKGLRHAYMCALKALKRSSGDRDWASQANRASTSLPSSVLFSRYLKPPQSDIKIMEIQ